MTNLVLDKILDKDLSSEFISSAHGQSLGRTFSLLAFTVYQSKIDNSCVVVYIVDCLVI